ncbi:D-glycero-beta-D-manno-heptose 1-phosphate adenylyltransferase [Hippea maritima]|uniref:D-glycero-beta-D-manno-heptose 1-phosphate adenylyltransferase n=1 Tax=Hippea maritima (strain ATCC 700847 / DSM 10411 / MH2) TaxID=760142 RepID=F2LTQ6_HIPMA|nr:D-glycero-beta-D-manno-heptose 1-phosphate adenylyltransferase [Hippea maritima]AEA34432.1 rfaE bifunctional protein [Hippea maritima DSM 10411]
MSCSNKVLNWDELRAVIEKLKKGKKIIGFTNGCFDILHAGHVSYLNKAKDMVDVLIVGLNSDSSVRKLKGDGRPINSQDDRALVLAALSSVDYVVVFYEDTPAKLIELIIPDVLIKGADWKEKGVAGADIVEKHGGRVEFIEFLNGRSTTNTIKRIIDVYCDK